MRKHFSQKRKNQTGVFGLVLMSIALAIVNIASRDANDAQGQPHLSGNDTGIPIAHASHGGGDGGSADGSASGGGGACGCAEGNGDACAGGASGQ